MVVQSGDSVIELGEPTADVDGDGVADSVVVESQDGSRTVFTDLDGDGDADEAFTLHTDGSVSVAMDDGQGNWTEVASGEVGPDGKLIMNQGPQTNS